jgi:hypothetical protein
VRGAESNLRPYRDLLHRHVSAMDVGAVKAPTIRRSQVMQTITTIGLDIANWSRPHMAQSDRYCAATECPLSKV